MEGRVVFCLQALTQLLWDAQTSQEPVVYYQWDPNVEKKQAQGHGATCSHALPVKLYLFLHSCSPQIPWGQRFSVWKDKTPWLVEGMQAKQKGKHLH